jgi:hypothetical protein
MQIRNLDIDVLHLRSKYVRLPYEGRPRAFFAFNLGEVSRGFPYNVVLIDADILEGDDDPAACIEQANVKVDVVQGYPAIIRIPGKPQGSLLFFTGVYASYDQSHAVLAGHVNIHLQKPGQVRGVDVIACGLLPVARQVASGVNGLAENAVYRVPEYANYSLWQPQVGAYFSVNTGRPISPVNSGFPLKKTAALYDRSLRKLGLTRR